MKNKVKEKIEEVLKGFGIENPKVVLEVPTHEGFGDYSTNVSMVYAKQLGKNPLGLAEDIKTALEGEGMNFLKKIEIAKPGFINLFFNPPFFKEALENILNNKNWLEPAFMGKKFFVEHTQPNPFKEFHIGHLMNNSIGESLSRIIGVNGAETKVATYHGDKGLHVAKAVWAMARGISLEESYSFGHKAYEEDEKAKLEIIEINKKVYDGSDVEINSLYENGKVKSFEHFESLYERLGSKFDYHFFESESGEVGKKFVLENVGRVFAEGEGGAIIFKGEDFEPKTHTRVFLNSDKLPTYEAKELGLARIKESKFEFDESITITANEQDSFFKVVEVAIGEVFPELKGKLKHLSHGVLKLPSGKMSSRTGTIISAESLIDSVKEKVREKIDDDSICEIIAIGAIKYSILRQAVGGDIIFDLDKSVSLEGDSGPYLQYSAVRAKSLLEKAKGIITWTSDVQVPEGWQTTNLERKLEQFGEVVSFAGKEYSPSHIATYLIDLAGEFNSFYAGGKIIDEKDDGSGYKLWLTQVFVEVMSSGLYLLGIKVPDRM